MGDERIENGSTEPVVDRTLRERGTRALEEDQARLRLDLGGDDDTSVDDGGDAVDGNTRGGEAEAKDGGEREGEDGEI